MYTKKDIISNVLEYERIKKDPSKLIETYELDRCVQWINAKDVHKVCVQFPDALLHDSVDVALYLEAKLNRRVYILGDTSYGSCCVDEVAAQHVGATGIIHFGRACLSPTNRIPVLYIFEKETMNVTDFMSYFKEVFPTECQVLLVFDVSYSHVADTVAKELSRQYPNVVVSELACDDDRCSTKNYILGRNFSLTGGCKLTDYKVVFIGEDGRTLLNFRYAMTGSQFYLFNPSLHTSLQCYEENRSVFLRKRMYLIEKIKDSKALGILIGTLGVTNYLGAVNRIKALTKRKGIKCYIIAVGKPNIVKLANFPEIEVFVLIACPENSLLDSKDFYQPIVTLYEVELAFNSQYAWSETYITDFTTLLPGGSNYVEEKSTGELEEEELPDISLISGQLRQATVTDEETNNEVMGTISLKSDTTVSVGGQYLSTRSWSGLEQNLGKTEVQQASVGRKGIPQTYTSEHHL